MGQRSALLLLKYNFETAHEAVKCKGLTLSDTIFGLNLMLYGLSGLRSEIFQKAWKAQYLTEGF